jgi:aldose 1-epimerase
MDSATTNVQLQSGDSQVTLCPEIGGAIARFTWKGHDILRRAPDNAIAEKLVRQMGVYPLVPYSNRIAQARLIVGDRTISLRPNFMQEPHSIHGFGWQRAWQVEKRSTDSVVLQLQHAADADWPFACEATETVSLSTNALQIALTVKNTDKQTMPAGLGFHPYFPILPGTHLQSEWKGMWKMGADSLPTELTPVPAEADFTQLRPVEAWRVDHCFTGWSRRAILDYPTYRMQLDASDACRQIVVFSPNDGRNFIALEPVTNINNAFALMAKGVANTGTRTLSPGQSFEISMSITLSGRAAAKVPDA